ncbi:DUF6236 family protein [Streptomyces orinoci]|uniref:DUF6236 family protein n=1 Tax=Streptomyces orinoci TaxID=67339 RepID=A0ABV3JUJ2_STRON|nr:DUF6236 family protein [Streptomyces orinoci]
MDDLALYYPFAHIQNDAWLKAAALYWTRIGRIRPGAGETDFPRRDSAVARALTDATNLIVDLSTDGAGFHAAGAFADRFLSESEQVMQLRQRYPCPPQDIELVDPVPLPGSAAAREDVEWIFAAHESAIEYSKVPPGLVEGLVGAGLGVLRARDGWHWLGVHPDLARLYLTWLAHVIADEYGLRLVTDQLPNPESPTAWTTHTVVDDVLPPIKPSARALYAAVALNTVVPGNLEQVPVERIIKARQELAPQFAAFRAHLDDLGGVFADCDGTGNLQILRARVEQLAHDKILQDVADLERGLRQLKLEPVKATMRLKSFELPAVAAAAASALPHIHDRAVLLDAGVVAACFFSAVVDQRRSEQQLRRGAAGYLLSLGDLLTPGRRSRRLPWLRLPSGPRT